MDMDRKNSFHLLLSDDELALLHMLAEREGLNASDFLRMTLRRMAGMSAPQMLALRSSELLRSLGVEGYTAQGRPILAKRRPAKKKKSP